MNKIRIAYILGLLGMGGAERQLFHLINGLDRDKYDILVISLSENKDEFWAKKIKKLGIDVIIIPRINRGFRAWKIRKVILAWKADIIQGFHFYVNGYGVIASWLKQIPVIGGMRNLPNERHINKVPLLWRNLCICSVTKLVCNSKPAVKILKEKYPKLSGLTYIPNGVECKTDDEIKTIRQNAENALDKDDKKIILGYVGQLIPRKNISLLIKAGVELTPLYPELTIVIVGDGWFRSELEKEVSQYGVDKFVKFIGSRDDAVELMSAFDIMCLPSNYEGMPNVVMEAGAAGVPAVATDIAGTSDLIIDNKTGFLFKPGDKDDLVKKIKQLIDDPKLRRAMGIAARNRMKECFSVNNMADQYESLYDELLDT